ncbi:serine/threonine-protein kinase [Pendulispora albinea]|uniref:Protein kinase n=1 Tax=Pendulispora albinea TaxID=2741071 RepID=A0ABZ2LU21_9BACT
MQKLRAQDRLGGKYLLIKRIALGGMGQIWIARNEMTDAEVALKVLRADLDKRIQVEPRFRHEARLGAMLSHRNIVRIYDLVEDAQDGSLVLVMELLRGETLRRHLKKKGPLPAEEAIAIILPVLSALEHAHEMGVVHRDIKPANIFLAVDPDGHVTPKLLDFGIAKLPQGGGVLTLDGRVLGTPRYMSPEQIRSETTIDGRSDVFSVGAVLVEMLTGHSPFAAETPSASLASVLETMLDPDPSIDPRLWLVLQRALSKRAYERYAHCAEFSQALRDAIGVSDHALIANLRRSKPPPRISTTLSIHRPDDPAGVHAASLGLRQARRLETDYDDESVDEDSSDYAMDVVSSQSDSTGNTGNTGSESISGYRASSGLSSASHGVPMATGSHVQPAQAAPALHHPHVRLSRGRVLVFGAVLLTILALVFCGGIFFREAADRVTNRKPTAPAEAPTSPAVAPVTESPAVAADPGAVMNSPVRSDSTAGVTGTATAPSGGPAGSASAVPSGPAIRGPRPGTVVKKKVATQPGF